jgi:hypothetical protein
MFKFDLSVYSQGWIYWWLLLPAFGYTIFFMLKWVILFAPLSIPLGLVSSAIRNLFGFGSKKYLIALTERVQKLEESAQKNEHL